MKDAFESAHAEIVDQESSTDTATSDSDSDALHVTPADLESLQLSAVEHQYPGATPLSAAVEQTYTNPYCQSSARRYCVRSIPVLFALDVPAQMDLPSSSASATAISYKDERGTKFGAFLQPFIAHQSRARDHIIVSKGKDLDVSFNLKQFLNSMPPDNPAYTTVKAGCKALDTCVSWPD